MTKLTPPRFPEALHDLFEKKSFAYLATLGENCVPHVTPVWIDYNGEYLLVNSVKGRVKDRNMRERPSIALCVHDPEKPYRYVSVQGTVVEITAEGAKRQIDQLTRRYTGAARYDVGPSEIRPEHIVTAR